MPASSADRNPIEQLAEEFAARYRGGERPSLTEYTTKYPELADEIRELFPALVAMERLKPDRAELTGDYAGDRNSESPGLQCVGDYRILRKLGEGGMGIVYEAVQESLGRHVALKVLPAHALDNPTHLERFRREARAAGRLHHTNIVPVFGVGEEDGVHHFAMQFIPGEGLDKVLRDLRRLRDPGGAAAVGVIPPTAAAAQSLLTGRFEQPAAVGPNLPPTAAPATPEVEAPQPPDENPGSTLPGSGAGWQYCRGVARIGLQAAEALAYAHKQGILHRDIKPSNLLLDRQGTVWVADFGLAKTEGSDLTGTGEIVGTLRFMAPERLNGTSLPQSDIYSLGLTLYELLTLRPAFDDGDRMGLIDRLLHELPVPPRQLEPRIPRDLETLVLKCIAKDPAERYPTAEALAEDLRRFLADRPIHARRTPWHERTWRWCRRNPVVATLSGVLLLVLTATALGGVVLSIRLSNALGQAQADRDKARSLVSDITARRFSGRFVTLEAIRKASTLAHELEMPPATFDELRNRAITALALPDIHLLKEWEGWSEGNRGLAFDDRLEHYARGDTQGNITVRRMADDVEIARRSGEGPHVGIDGFDEGGRALVLLDSDKKSRKRWRFDATEAVPLGNQSALFTEDNWTITTADQKLLVRLDRKTGIVGVHDLATGKHLRDIRFGKWAAGTEPVPECMWDMHPWRHELAISLGTWQEPERELVRILDLDRGTVQAELVTNPRMYIPPHGHQLAWLPDGRTLAVAYAQVVVLWDVPSVKEVGRITDHKGGGLAVSASRSGQFLTTYSYWAGGVKFWHPYTRKLLLSLPSMSIHPTTQAPDGRMYTSRTEGTRLQLWATEPSPVLRVLVRSPIRGPLGEYRRASVHRDGRLLAVGSSQGVSLFDLSRGLDVGHLDLGHTLTVQFDPATGDLLTFGALGLLRWPVRKEPESSQRLRIGPPQRLLIKPATDNEFRISRDGRTIAAADYSRVVVLHADQPDRPVILAPTGQIRQQLSLSPDGRWVATGSHGGGDIQVWDARTGRLVRSEPLNNNSCEVLFSPDGKRLLTWTGGSCRYWEVGDWDKPSPQIDLVGGSHPEFTPDGKLLPAESGDGAIRLLNANTGRELVRLESPDQGRCRWTTFSPDGNYLIATNGDSAAIHVWDLYELRRQLQDMDLDWDAPPYPAAERPNLLLPPLDVEVNPGKLGGFQARAGEAPKEVIERATAALRTAPDDVEAYHLRGHAHQQLRDFALAAADFTAAIEREPAGAHLYLDRSRVRIPLRQFALAIADMEKSLALRPEHAETCNNLAWLYATGPENLCDPGKAVALAERAVKLQPQGGSYKNTLGVAYYRAGHFRKAVELLEAACKDQGRATAFDLFFLAMCRAKLGDPAKAGECLDRAVKWVEGQKDLAPQDVEDLKAFRTEAEAVVKRP